MVTDLVGCRTSSAGAKPSHDGDHPPLRAFPPKLPADHALDTVTITTPNDQGLLLELILKGTTEFRVAARLGSTPELCRLGLDILSWQKLKTRLPSCCRSHQGRAQDRDRPRRLHGCGHSVQGRPPALHPDRVHRPRPGGAARRTPGSRPRRSSSAGMARLCYDGLGARG